MDMADIARFVGPIVGVHLVVFVLLVLIVKRLLLNTTMQAIDTVRQVESDVRKKESGVVRQIEEHEKELSRYKAEAEQDLERRRRKSEQEVAQLREKMIDEARAESERIVQRARQEEENLRQRMALELEEKAVERSSEILGMVFSDTVFADLNKVLVDELIEALDEMDTEGIMVDGQEASFRTARPLDESQRQRLREVIRENFEIDIAVDETVDETLLGGLAFKLGSLEIDGSLRHRLQEAQEVLGKDEE